MFRSHSIPGAFALAACLLSFFAVSARPVHAVEPLPDARILSSTPFDFRADREIFSRMNPAPSDAGILRPPLPLRSADEPAPKRQSTI